MSKDSTSNSSSSSGSSNPLQAIARPNLTADEQRELNEKLFKAIGGKKENLILVKKLINQGADIKAVDNDGSTPLHKAAYFEHTEITKLLLQKDADIKAMDNHGSTPLHYAALYGCTETAIALLQNGADVKAVNNYGNTPLLFSALRGYTKTTIALLQNGADVNVANEFRSTPLHKAAENGHTETAKVLLQNGANPSARNNDGRTTLDIAENKDIRSFLTNCINFQKELKSIFDKMVESFSKTQTARNGKEEASTSNHSTDLDETLKSALEAAKNRFLETAKDLASKNKDLFSPEFHPFNMALDDKGNSVFHLMANEALKLGDGAKRDQYLGLLVTLAKESGSEKIQEMINRATTISKELRPSVASNIEEIIVSYLHNNDTERTQASQTNIDDNLATALHLAANKGVFSNSINSNQSNSSSSSSSAANKPKKPGIMDRFLDTIFCRNNAEERESYPAINMEAASSSSSTYSGSKEEEKSAPAARGNNTDNQTPATFVQNPSAAATSSKYQQNKR